jgi:hypothetical protein
MDPLEADFLCFRLSLRPVLARADVVLFLTTGEMMPQSAKVLKYLWVGF